MVDQEGIATITRDISQKMHGEEDHIGKRMEDCQCFTQLQIMDKKREAFLC